MFTDIRDHMIEDNEYYETTDKRLKEAYDYAQERYKMVQKKIFIEGQDNFWKILTHVRSYASRAAKDFNDKYGRTWNHRSFLQVRQCGTIQIGFQVRIRDFIFHAGVFGIAFSGHSVFQACKYKQGLAMYQHLRIPATRIRVRQSTDDHVYSLGDGCDKDRQD